MVIAIEPATVDDIDRLVELETKLFREDAAQHDTFVDLSWPQREGRADFTRLVVSPVAVVLVARDDDEIVGHLVGHVSDPTPTRQPVTYAVLRSIYVEADHRHQGVGQLLTSLFVSWAREHGCVEAHVASYLANEAAQQFYERRGFVGRSVSRVLPL
jgi:GNAT superfamily N-acetyltransferase